MPENESGEAATRPPRRGHRARRHGRRDRVVARRRLASRVAVCDVREAATAPFREGARVAATPADLAAMSDVVFVVVFSDAQVRAVLEGPEGVFAGAAAGHHRPS